MQAIKPKGLPMLIGSLPLEDHTQALDWVFKYSPYIPLWVQLPKRPFEGMISQFMESLPGYTFKSAKEFIDTASPLFHEEMVSFYEEYMGVIEGKIDVENSRFKLNRDRAAGFYHLVERLSQMDGLDNICAIKGQITGPITFATAVKDAEGRAIFYEHQLRDMAIKHLTMLSAYQASVLSRFNKPVIIFLDEPALAGFGSSEFISISREDVLSAFSEIINYLHSKNVLVGIHVCANTDWSLVFDSGADILSFDAYSYFDKLVLFKDKLKNFLSQGKFIAWGIVPTDAKYIEKETFDNLYNKFMTQLNTMKEQTGLDKSQIIINTFITPSCGAGSLNIELAQKVLSITCDMYKAVLKM
ncbi:uroporphyrinogen decarboxylase/cobalamine-independent methonine synthase family protein [Desulfothermus naphthae]